MPALACPGKPSSCFAVEDRSERYELADPSRTLVHQEPHRVGVAQARPRGQGVGEVQVGGVLVPPEHGRHPALGPPGRGLRELGLREHTYAHAGDLGQPDDGGQPGHTRTEDQDVEHCGARAHPRGARQPLVIRVSSSSSCAPITSTGLFEESTCTIFVRKFSSSDSS